MGALLSELHGHGQSVASLPMGMAKLVSGKLNRHGQAGVNHCRAKMQQLTRVQVVLEIRPHVVRVPRPLHGQAGVRAACASWLGIGELVSDRCRAKMQQLIRV